MTVTLNSGLVLPTGAQPLPDFQADQRPVRTRGGLVRVAGSAGSPERLYTYPELYRAQPSLFGVINKLVRAMVRVPVTVERPAAGGGYEPVEDEHKLARLLRAPAPRKGYLDLMQWLMFPALLHGNSLIVKGRGADGLPEELFPVQWPFIQAYRRQAGWIDRWRVHEDGVNLEVAVEDVLHLAWMGCDGVGGEIGVSALEPLAETLSSEDAAQRRHTATMRRGRPDAVFTLPADVAWTPELERQIKTSIREYTNPDNDGDVPVLFGGAEWQRTGLTTVETALIEARELNRLEVCVAFDVSPTVIGILEHATQKTNIADLTTDFYGNTLGPWFQLGQSMLQRQLVDAEPAWRDEGLRVRFDPSEFLRGDPLKWAQALNLRVAGGGLMLNERRDLDGLRRVDDPKADELMVSDNNVHPLSQVGEDQAPAMVAEAAALLAVSRA